MKILITGITGFVGPYLRENLMMAGHEVFGLDRNQQRENVSNMYYSDILDAENIRDIIVKIQPDSIIHLAGFSSVKKSFEQPGLCQQVNVEGTENLLKASLALAKPPKVLIITSAEVYGVPKAIPITEDHLLNPATPYGKSRKEQEAVVKRYHQKLPIIILRSFNHTGPGQRPDFVVARFVEEIVKIEKGGQRPEILVGNLDAIRDFTDVRDIVSAYQVAMEKGEAGQTYNICSGRGEKIEDILQNLLAKSSKKIDIKPDHMLLRPSDIPELVGSRQKFTLATCWRPQIPFEQTLDDMLDWQRSRFINIRS